MLDRPVGGAVHQLLLLLRLLLSLAVFAEARNTEGKNVGRERERIGTEVVVHIWRGDHGSVTFG